MPWSATDLVGGDGHELRVREREGGGGGAVQGGDVIGSDHVDVGQVLVHGRQNQLQAQTNTVQKSYRVYHR